MAAKYHLKNRVSIITQFYPPDYAATPQLVSLYMIWLGRWLREDLMLAFLRECRGMPLNKLM